MKCVRRDLSKEDIVKRRGATHWIYDNKEDNTVSLMINGDKVSKKSKDLMNMLYFKRDYIVVCRDLTMEEKKKLYEEKLAGKNIRLYYRTSEERSYVEYMVENVEITKEGIRINCK